MSEEIKHYDRTKFEDITSECRFEFGNTGVSIFYGNKRIVQSRKIDELDFVQRKEIHTPERSAQMFYVVPEFRSFVHLHQYPMSFAILRRR